MNKFEIIKTSSEEVYVTIIGTGNFGEFISELEYQLFQLRYKAVKVYLDMFLRHGIDNRFFILQFENNKLNLNTLDEVNVNIEVQRIYNKYIFLHQEIMTRGLLSTNQQIRFLDHIKTIL